MPALFDIANALQPSNWGQQVGENIQRNRLLREAQQEKMELKQGELTRKNALSAALQDPSQMGALIQADPEMGFKLQQNQAVQTEQKRKLTADEFNSLDDRMTKALAGTKDDAEAAALWPRLDAYAMQVTQGHPELQAAYRQHFAQEYNPSYRQMAAEPVKATGPTDLMQNLADPQARAYLEADQARKAAMGEGSGASPYFQFLPGADGYLVGNARTGQIAPGMVNGQRAVPGALDPNLQQDLSRAKETGQGQGQIATEATKKVRNANSTLSILDDADALVDKATGSILGSGYDSAQKLYGGTNAGADAIGQLQVLGAALTANVPRMEGPQSDRDVQMYREAAGNLGDPTIPNARKKAAIKTIRTLQGKYQTLNGAGPPPAQNGPREGATATNQQTGQKIVFSGGQWVSQ